jgi:hypothetical protein
MNHRSSRAYTTFGMVSVLSFCYQKWHLQTFRAVIPLPRVVRSGYPLHDYIRSRLLNEQRSPKLTDRLPDGGAVSAAEKVIFPQSHKSI